MANKDEGKNKKLNNNQEDRVISAGVEKREISDELQESYLDYAMSVIVSRALPDVRDGLKPVQRRILWAMWESGLRASAKYRKSAAVIGEVLKSYHPHGDVAVYDALARMAQDFSLRYPLIDGQGNWGCFTKDTKIKLVDGRNVSFEELVKENRAGKKNYTYSVNNLGLIAVAEIKNPRLTKKSANIIKVVLDNGEEIKCTPNHRFMLKDGLYKEAKDLTSEDSLMPFYQRLSENTDRINREGYVLVYQPKKDEWVPSHHLADNYNLTLGKYKKSAGRVRHHADFNKLNNSPENILRMHWGDHWQIHYSHVSAQHKNPEYRKKISEGRKKYWADPANKEKNGKLLSERNIKNWQNPEYREKMRLFLSVVNKEYIRAHPEKRAEIGARATKTLKRLWQNPEYRSFMREKIIKGNKNHTTNKTGKLKFLNVCKEILNQNIDLNENNYELFRSRVYPYGRATSWSGGLAKYFQNNADLIRQEINQNHRIVKIEKLSRKEDVYDLTIEGTHNFCLAAGVFVHNSIDGDNQAAMRYTECRLSKIAEELLFDIEKETVDWNNNYDGTIKEPMVLPAKLPHLLLNGASGIAVGMATSIPPHNISEVIDATLHLVDSPKATTEDLLKFIQGPDFPTGGVIYDKKTIAEAYSSGRGSVPVRAVAEIEERKKDQYNIVITEIPYQVNKSELLSKIAALVTDKKIQGIKDLRDESDREGLRIVVELKNDVSGQKILNQLYKHTDLQKNFNLNMIALVGGLQPQLLSLKEFLSLYIEHRKEVVRRRAEFDLKKAKERAHILEGLSKALSVIDKVIETIKKSKDKEDARKNLISKFKLTEIQAEAILEMKLSTLAALERQKIEDELKEKKKLINELEILLKSPQKILKVIKDELSEIKESYGDERRTKIVAGGLKEFKEEDLIPEEELVITLSQNGYIKRGSPTAFRSQQRGGKGLIASDVGEEDLITHFIAAHSHDNILFFTEKGRVFQTKVYEIPSASRQAKGKVIQNFLEIPPDEKVSAIVSYPTKAKEQEGQCLVMATSAGVVKKTPLSDFANIRRTGIIAMNLQKGDTLRWVKSSSGKDEVLIVTALGQAIRFKESQLRPMSRIATGVKAIKLKKAAPRSEQISATGDDFVVGLDIINTESKEIISKLKVLVVTENGFAKQTALGQYKTQKRSGQGIKTAKITAKTGKIVSAQVIFEEQELLALSTKGQIIKTTLKSVRTAGRATSGVKIMTLKGGDKLAGAVTL